MRGCLCHGIALLMKDFCRFKATTGRNAPERTFGMKWAEDVVRSGNTIANFLQDSGPARSLVRSLVECQQGAKPASCAICCHMQATGRT